MRYCNAMTDALPALYSFRRCPYAMRARLAINASGAACLLREVVLRDKPPEMLEISPKGTVPVLHLPNGQVIDESLDIMHWVLGQSDPEGWLAAAKGDDADALIAANDGPFKRALDRYKYPTRYEGVDPFEQREKGLEILSVLEGRLEQAPYLCGDQFSLADAAVAPFVRQFANTDPSWFKGTGLKALQRWLEEFLASPRFLAVMAKYPQWKPGTDEPRFPLSAG